MNQTPTFEIVVTLCSNEGEVMRLLSRFILRKDREKSFFKIFVAMGKEVG